MGSPLQTAMLAYAEGARGTQGLAWRTSALVRAETLRCIRHALEELRQTWGHSFPEDAGEKMARRLWTAYAEGIKAVEPTAEYPAWDDSDDERAKSEALEGMAALLSALDPFVTLDFNHAFPEPLTARNPEWEVARKVRPAVDLRAFGSAMEIRMFPSHLTGDRIGSE
jgi:Arc/MetJ family transcription regulator